MKVKKNSIFYKQKIKTRHKKETISILENKNS